MQQLIPFDPAKGGKEAGKCLKNTRLGYGIPAKYSNAITAWLNTEQHKDRNFPALDIPIYFSYKEDGHIGNRFANGQFWSDGKTYSSLEAYEKNHAPEFLGWGESVNNVKVIGGNVPTVTDISMLSQLWAGFLDRPVYENEKKEFIGRPLEVIVDTVYNSKEFKDRMNGLRKMWAENQNKGEFEPYTGKQLFTKKG